MLFGRYGTFAGGINLPDEKKATLGSPIRACPKPSRLLVPLAGEGVPSAQCCVTPGQRVQAGERIAERGEGQGVNVYAPLAGRVGGLTMASVIGAAGFFRAPAIELTDVSDPPELPAAEATVDHRTASAQTLRELLEGSDVLTHRRWPRPLRWWVRQGRQHECTTLIVNAMENQPRVTADHRLLVERGPQVIAGASILARAVGVKTAMLAVDGRRTGDYRALVAPAREAGIQLMALSHKYPIGVDAILVKVLARREVPLGSNPMRLGCVIIDAATAMAAWQELSCQSRLGGRVVTLAGEGLAEAGNFFVPFGTPCLELARSPGGFTVHGGPMVGSRCPADAVVTAATDVLLALGARPSRPSTSCIRCGWCTDNCPARLNVSALNDHFELGALDAARSAGVIACVECGICTYVCPSRLPLSQRTKGLKHALSRSRRGGGEPT
ncbi:MAG: 4Fe-4S dicluster domain-containing protein [Planctomycetota bacterium]|nr:4Fe-4S dicluster domain-containing protein [Planctomycetota bacterium]